MCQTDYCTTCIQHNFSLLLFNTAILRQKWCALDYVVYQLYSLYRESPGALY